MLTLEPLSPRLATVFKTVRLRALQDMPSAFGRTYAEESQLSDADWLNRTAIWNTGTTSICYIAIDNGEPCGIIGGYLDDHDPPRPNVGSMWVAPSYRRIGLGTSLLDKVQRWAQNLGAPELRLMVTGGNAAAIRFYEQCGFALTGATEPYPPNPVLLQYEMIKPLTISRTHFGV
jgi:ribosomal protein S18 acetylase RimI-like enzyme